MIRNIQNKIVFVFFMLGLIIITGLGFYFTTALQNINIMANTETFVQADLNGVILSQISQMKIAIIIGLFIFGVFCILAGIFLSKTVIMPINRLLVSAKKNFKR